MVDTSKIWIYDIMMVVDGTLWVEVIHLGVRHLRHCVWRYDVMMGVDGHYG